MSTVLNLFKDYGDFRVSIPKWIIADQGITALKGPSGSGKTSVIRLLIGLEPSPTLSWRFGDADIAKLPIEEKRLGVVFQNYELFPHLTALGNLKFAAKARNISKTDFEKNTKEMGQILKIEHLWDRRASNLSGGEKQRVALARALIGHPRFLFLDEPFSALDQENKNEARELVIKLVEKFKIPSLLVTHDQVDIDMLAHTTVEISNGQIKT